MARQVLENGVILPAEYSDDWYDDMTSNLTKLDDVIGSDSEKLSSSDVGAAALSNNYNDLDNLPTIPTVNDATLTIQKNGVDVQTFTANASSNVTCDITVPTKTSDLTNDSNFVDTSNAAVSSGITSAKVTDYDTHIADTDIHVTTADKNRWNNQTYVFRYSSTALVDSSTNSNALLDNTDNLKVGDKVIDSSGVLFSIIAIDTQNSTFTIGTALIDLAQDSDVVHKSGDETVGGSKTFDSNTYVYNSDNTATTPNLFLKNSKVTKGSTSETGAQLLKFVDKNNSSVGELESIVTSLGATELRIRSSTLDSNNQNVQTGVTLISNINGAKRFCPTSNNDVFLGVSTLQWARVYSTQYYYGSDNVEFSTKFVTTDTNQTISGQKLFNDINAISSSSEIGVSAGNNSFRVVDKNQKVLARIQGGTFSTGMAYSYWLVNNGTDAFNGVSLYQASANLVQLRPYDSTLSAQLGASNRYFANCYTSKVNNLEPSSLSLPSGNANDVIDISSYLSNLDGTDNTYVAPANGWITINMNNCSGIHATITGFWGDSRIRASAGAIKFLMPVLKNQTVTLTIHGGTINNARFIPCQGNV